MNGIGMLKIVVNAKLVIISTWKHMQIQLFKSQVGR